MAKLPRGIQIVEWRNDDKSKSVRYRVRIQRKTFKADELFDNQDDAERFLADSKSQAGRKAIVEQDAAEVARGKAIFEFFTAPPLSYYLDQWGKREWQDMPTKKDTKKTREDKRKAMSEAKWKRGSVALSRIRVIKRVKVEYVGEMFRGVTGAYTSAMIHPKKPFGEFKLPEISSKTATKYIEARLAEGASASTVKRDVGFLSSFFGTWLPNFDEPAAAKLGGNPFDGLWRKGKLKNADKRRDIRLDQFGADAETRLLTALRSCRNPEMIQIVSLALSTGMRRGEILALTWDKVGEKYIQLLAIDTKTNKARKIPLSDETRKILATIPRDVDKPTARLFSYTADGFKSVWSDVVVRAKLEGFRFHDLRHEFVSRLLEFISSPIAAASVSGYGSVKNFVKQHVEPWKDRAELEHGIRSERGLMLAGGHEGIQTTANYAGEIGAKVMQGADEARRNAASPAKYPIVVEEGEGKVAVYSPDFSVTAAGATEEQAMGVFALSVAKWLQSGNAHPKPSSPTQIALQYPDAVVRMVAIG